MKTSLNQWLKTVQDVLLIRKKKILVYRIAILLIIGTLAKSFRYHYSRKSLFEELIKSKLSFTANRIYSEIQRYILRPLFISSLMAHNTFLLDFVLDGENNPNSIARYHKEIKEKFNGTKEVGSKINLEIETLREIIPKCCISKKIREDKVFLNQVMTYIPMYKRSYFQSRHSSRLHEKNYPNFAPPKKIMIL